MKKISITIKAAILGAIIGGLFILFELFFPILSESIKKKNVESIITQIDFSVENKNSGIKLLKELSLFDKNQEIEQSGWIDLKGDGQKSEYFAIIYKKWEDFKYLAIISIRDNKKELIYYDKSYYTDDLSIDFFKRGNIPQVLIYTIGGTGHYLSFDIYEFDGISRLDKKYSSSGYSDGIYYFINNGFYISGNAKRYKLKYLNNAYKLYEYHLDLKAVPYSASHILSFSNFIKFRIFYDGKEIKFTIKEDKSLETNDVIQIEYNDIMLIDDNIINGPEDSIRFYSDYGEEEKYKIIYGFYDKIKFIRKGYMELAMRGNYYNWYHLKFFVQ
jgi:hypothetical protein